MSKNIEASGLTRRLAEYYSSLDYESLPPEVVDRAKYFCLDYLAVAIRGSTTDSAQAMARVVGRLGGGGDAPVMGTPLRASPEYAALANGTSAHSIELDDVNNESSLHPGVATFPAAFACAHLTPVDGRSFIGSIVCGYDLMVRLGYALDPRLHYARGFHPTGTCGTFAAALVASRLMGQDSAATTSALGIAGSQAAGSLEWLEDGAWTKRMHPGWAAHSGVIATLLAGEGFVGPSTALEGRHGFLQGYSDDADPDKLTDRLGELFYITKVGIKPHACCRYNQGPIDCMLKIRNEHDLSTDDVDGIEEVKVGMLSVAYPIVATPVDQKRNPQNVVDAQFSVQFGAAVAATYGKATLDEYSEATLADPRVKGLMAKIRGVEDPSLDEEYPEKWASWVEVKTKDGRTLRADTPYPLGDPENPLSWQQLEDKFRSLTGPVISQARQDEIISAVRSLEDLEDVKELAWLTAL